MYVGCVHNVIIMILGGEQEMGKKDGMQGLDNDQIFEDWTETLEQALPNFWVEFNQIR